MWLNFNKFRRKVRDIRESRILIHAATNMNIKLNRFWSFTVTFILTSVCSYFVISSILLLDDIGVFRLHPEISLLDNDFIVLVKALVPFLIGSLLSAAFVFYLRLRLAPRPISLNFIIAVAIPLTIAIGFGFIFSYIGLALRGGF